MGRPDARGLLAALGAEDPRLDFSAREGRAGMVVSLDPTTGRALAGVRLDDAASYERSMQRAESAFRAWRRVPAPVRGQMVREVGDELRRHRENLGALITLEVGKIRSEGVGEVQEVVDIADFAVGLSRQLYGKTMPSERPGHRMYEQWLPLGVVGVITAFNFPCAVWGWNAMLAAVCGDSVVWKPSLEAPLTGIATNAICRRVAERHGHPDVFTLVIGTDAEVGERLVGDGRVPLVSATGSCRMGRHVGQRVAARLGRCLLELGGNNALIVSEDADLDVALKSVVFGAVGAAGQRCTTTRRLIVHESIAERFIEKVVGAYRGLALGDPLDARTHVGPLISESAGRAFDAAIAAARAQGGELLAGGRRAEVALGGTFVEPALVREPPGGLAIALEETFAPILYVRTYRDLGEAITLNNMVSQGLSSAIYTSSLERADQFLSPSGEGSDCGLAYVNLGTSGAEIGGAFGGEKDTGGGRESGSDSWKAYMRRQTCTVNFGGEFRLAQGISFGGTT